MVQINIAVGLGKVARIMENLLFSNPCDRETHCRV